jgi:cyclic pyranopterin phosphate synthase
MTTNATLLATLALPLKRAGLHRVNISLDSLRAERFHRLTGADMLGQVKEGIEAALEAGFHGVKLNVVVIRGVNDDELAEFALLGVGRPLEVRFIEFMPTATRQCPPWSPERLVGWQEMRRELEKSGALSPLPGSSGPERRFRYSLSENSSATVGFISPLSQKFCSTCNRLRLSCEGKLRGCLLQGGGLDVRQALRGEAGSDQRLKEILWQAVEQKPESHLLDQSGAPDKGCGAMHHIGG